MPQLTTKPLSWSKRDPKQPRKLPDRDDDLTPEQRADLVHLGNSLKQKQLQPVLCQPDGTIIAGERRWRAARLVGMTTLEVKIADETLTEPERRVWQLVENMQRADLSGYEQWTGCAELMCMNPSWQMKDLAEHLSLDPSTVTRILSPSKCIAPVQDALREGKIGIGDCYAIAKLPHDMQPGLLAIKLSGASRDQLERAGRKARTPHAETVKQARIVCPLTTGTRIVVTGPAMDWDMLIEALQSALENARRANKDMIDVKTAERVWRDRAKAG